MLEFEAPIADYFSLMGINATFQRADNSEIPTIVIFDDNYVRDLKEFGKVTSSSISKTGSNVNGILLMKADVSNPKQYEKIIINTTVYVIERIEHQDNQTIYVIARKE